MLRVVAQGLAQQAHLARCAAPTASHAAQLLAAAHLSGSSGQQQSSWRGTSWAGASVALGAAAWAMSGSSSVAQADASPQVPLSPPADPYALPSAAGRLPKSITLYQYEVCPFCCKVKAFLDYHKLPYTTVEVNPLTKGELRWSTYRKVPVVVLDDQVVADSSAIISQLQAELRAAQGGVGGGKKAAGGGKGWLGGGKKAAAGGGVSEEEEQRWRKWVDERFVKVLTANIYRSWDESWSTFSYMTQQSHWSWPVQQSVRLAGAALMWRVGQGMPRKYNIQGDLREALYAEANGFVDAVGDRRFLGGDEPNLADLAVFGVLSAIRGTDTYNDLVLNSRIGPWLGRTALAVGASSEVKAAGGGAPAAA